MIKHLSRKKYWQEQCERLQVQLAGCGVAALGWNKKLARRKDFGWSASYADVLKLRKAFEILAKGKSPDQVLAREIGKRKGR